MFKQVREKNSKQQSVACWQGEKYWVMMGVGHSVWVRYVQSRVNKREKVCYLSFWIWLILCNTVQLVLFSSKCHNPTLLLLLLLFILLFPVSYDSQGGFEDQGETCEVFRIGGTFKLSPPTIFTVSLVFATSNCVRIYKQVYDSSETAF